VAERFELDEDAAKDAGDRAGSAGQRLRDAHRELVAVLDDRDGCWGDDDIGKAFANSYVEFADGTRDNTKMIATNLADTGKYVVSVVDEFVDADADNAREIDRVYADDIEGWTES
jgi:hypothetical protein